MTDRLPKGWKRVPLVELCHVEMGQSPPSSTYNTDGEGLPFFQGKAEFTELHPVACKWCSAPKKRAQENDVLISVRAPVGPTNLAPYECCIGRGLAALSPREGVESRFVLYMMRHLEHHLAERGTGTTFGAVTGNVLRSFPVLWAPPEEQHWIVARIEELFSALDAGVAALKRVRANLKRYRAALLKAAVEGKLTEEWRKAHPDVEPADRLLKRILAERRRRWEQAQRDKAKAKNGGTLASSFRLPPYKEPQAPPSSLPALPKGWSWATVEQLITRSEYGTSVKCAYNAEHEPVLRIPNIAGGIIDTEDLKFSTKPLALSPGDELRSGDVLICRTNGSISLVGKAALVAHELESPYTFASYLLRFRFAESQFVPQWVLFYLTSHPGRLFIESHAASSAGQHNISLSLIHTMPIPLPPEDEQRVINQVIDERLSTIEKSEEEVVGSLSRSARLRQGILALAFNGQISPEVRFSLGGQRS